MAYEKQTWANGDIITAAKLNHIEDGIDNSMVYPEVPASNGTYVLKATKTNDGLTYSWVAEE